MTWARSTYQMTTHKAFKRENLHEALYSVGLGSLKYHPTNGEAALYKRWIFEDVEGTIGEVGEVVGAYDAAGA